MLNLEIEIGIEELELRVAPSVAPGQLGYEGQPGNQGNGLQGYEGQPGNQGEVEPGRHGDQVVDGCNHVTGRGILRELGRKRRVDLPDDFLRFQVITKMPYPDLGDPWTAARQSRDPRWYALETAKALVQAYGRSCRHAEDHGVTYVLDAQFARFLQRYRPLLPEWLLDAAHPAMREAAARRDDAQTSWDEP